MKKKIAILLVLIMVFTICFTGCGNNSGNKGDEKGEDQQAEYLALQYDGVDLSQKVTLPDYYSFEVEKVEVNPTAEDYEQAYKEVAAQFNSEKTITEGDVEEGDTIYIDFVGTLEDGSKPSSMSATNHKLVLGAGGYIDGFEESIFGHKIGDTFVADCQFPANYPNDQSMANKKAKFEITIKSKQAAVEYTELNDEILAQTKYNSIDELKAAIREQVDYNFETQALNNVEQEIVSDILAKSEVTELNQTRVDYYKDLLNLIYRKLADISGVAWDEYRQQNFGINEEEYKAKCEESAIDTAKQEMILSAIAQKEDIKIKTQDYEEYKDYFLQQYQFGDEKGFEEFFGGVTLDQYLEYIGIVKGLIAEKIGAKVYEKCAK